MSAKPKIKELLDESACEHNKTKQVACNAPTPGATTGGCAFEGAQISLFPYADAAHLVHGPMTCLGSSWETRATGTSLQGRDLTQVGFTTEPVQGRSTTYATDIAKMLQVPVFHVNGEDPEAVAQVVSVAMDFRKEFHRDVVIDLHAFRRWGHNEGDEPAFTQPLLYDQIRRRETVEVLAASHGLGVEIDERLDDDGTVTALLLDGAPVETLTVDDVIAFAPA